MDDKKIEQGAEQTAPTVQEEKPDEEKPKKTRPDNAPKWVISWTQIHEVEFCKAFLAKHSVKCINGRFYDIDGFVDDEKIRVEIAQMLIPFYSSKLSQKVKNLFDALKLCCHSEPMPMRTDEIHLLNGVLKTDGTWIPQKRFCINRLNIEYHPEIRKNAYYPEKFLTFLLDLLAPEDMTTLQEYLGYCLIPSNKGQKALFLVGNGGEGKSRIGFVMQEIFGSNMLTGNFQRIETDKFFRYNLQNKLLMIDDDMQMTALPSTGYIKNLITAEIPVDVEAKGQQSEQARLYARFLCFGNGSPKALYDKTDGFARRLIILTTKPKPPNRIDDPFIAEKFLAEKEKIFCWMFDGLQRLIQNNFQFTISEKTRLNIAEALSDNCNIIDFLHDGSMMTFGTEYSVSCTELYNASFRGCGENALTALKRETFVTWLKNNEKKFSIAYNTHVPNEFGKSVRGFRGMKTIYKTTLDYGVQAYK